MKYLILFDENGRKKEAYPIDILMTAEKKVALLNIGFIETDEHDFGLYCIPAGFECSGKNGEGYVKGENGKPTDAPPYAPTKEEQTQKLYNECVKDLQAIDNDILQSLAADDDELLADLRAERQARIEEYQRDLKGLEA